VISLKKHIESNREELLDSALTSYRAALAAIGESGAQACPPVGSQMQQSLSNLRERLSTHATPSLVTETGQRVEEELHQWGEQAAGYFRQKANELKEILLIMARAAEAVGERDQRYTTQLSDFTARLQSFADLDDLTQIRESLVRSAIDLKACVDKMASDGQQSVAELRKELSTYHTRVEEAERKASMDGLTGLVNRRRIESELEFRVTQAKPFCIVIFDLNGFKQINDVHGHLAGDDVLKQFAAELRSAFRATDIVGRWGGDEFMVVLDCGPDQAQAYIERAREWVSGDYTIRAGGESRKVKVNVAIGLTAWLQGEPVTDTIGRADAAMYQQKRSSSERRVGPVPTKV